jgi:hypothetical protein
VRRARLRHVDVDEGVERAVGGLQLGAVGARFPAAGEVRLDAGGGRREDRLLLGAGDVVARRLLQLRAGLGLQLRPEELVRVPRVEEQRHLGLLDQVDALGGAAKLGAAAGEERRQDQEGGADPDDHRRQRGDDHADRTPQTGACVSCGHGVLGGDG